MGFSKSVCLLFHIKDHLPKIHNSVESKQISSAYSRLLSNYYIVHWNFPRPPAKKARRTSPIARSKVIMTRCNPGWVHFWLQTSSRFHLLLNYNILGRHVRSNPISIDQDDLHDSGKHENRFALLRNFMISHCNHCVRFQIPNSTNTGK